LILKELLNFYTKFIDHCSTYYIKLKGYLVVMENNQGSRVYEMLSNWWTQERLLRQASANVDHVQELYSK